MSLSFVGMDWKRQCVWSAKYRLWGAKKKKKKKHVRHLCIRHLIGLVPPKRQSTCCHSSYGSFKYSLMPFLAPLINNWFNFFLTSASTAYHGIGFYRFQGSEISDLKELVDDVSGSQSAASTSPGILLEKWILVPTLSFWIRSMWRKSPAFCTLTSPPGESDAGSSLSTLA